MTKRRLLKKAWAEFGRYPHNRDGYYLGIMGRHFSEKRTHTAEDGRTYTAVGIDTSKMLNYIFKNEKRSNNKRG